MLFRSVGDAGTIVTSNDGGATWAVLPQLTQNGNPVGLNSVVFGSRFVAVGQDLLAAQPGTVAYSNDGINWFPTSAGTANLSRVVFTPAMYVAVGEAGANAFAK